MKFLNENEDDMGNDAAAASLRALATGSENRSKIGRIRELHAEIENAKKAGVSDEKIVETLNEQGFNTSLVSFKTMLKRVRKEQGKEQAAMAAKSTPKKGVVANAATSTVVTPPSPPAPKKPGEPDTFNWDPEKNVKPEW